MYRIFIPLLIFSFYKESLATFYAQVMDLRSGEITTYPRGTHHLMFASSQKIFTVFSGLSILGSDFQFDTKILTDGTTKGGKLLGNLYIKFDGNPDLRESTMLYISQKLKGLDINEIQGNIILDISEFDNKPYPHGWTIENQNMCYAAPFSAVIINKNCSAISIKRKGEELIASSLNDFIKINSKAKYHLEDCDLDLEYKGGNKYLLTGSCNIKNKTEFKIAVREPILLVRQLLEKNFQKLGIRYRKLIVSNSPAKAEHCLFSIKSRPLWAIAKEVLTRSDNLLSEVIVKKIGAVYDEGSWKNGLRVMNSFLQRQIHTLENDINIADGSGLSRKNLININSFSLLLSKLALTNYRFSLYSTAPMNQNCRIELDDKFILKDFMVPRAFKFNQLPPERILVKTGFIDGVNAVAGYIMDCNSVPIYSIVAVVNNSYSEAKTNRNNLAEGLEKIICGLDSKNCFLQDYGKVLPSL
ncbi:MAG: D-alanyl-D-alanine carboxypeptidase/D-alanyl-D-alanine-endopeptidase [Candidatus Midichloria mitochondrii]|uniref:D-alanyl-D-alanine carboxypeptidase/D-alanyl-D-alanine-endopeptidase n=1 Tax=Midichloria mitochondrii (strain IricVA) TaxID=696127 RepID=F7XWU7_MIDMI|nr:D-alanyl-D-alanine carboxypeptidase/D-alanyl-D-alanine-endopeptidase [Candidatus Midichloria mitochondrii]AEI89146.1 D-alanyl-D-alanine carboxypeptidase/D-alanyl-D-alanine-endopeptidase [Candidatus Midichloria mitochondrii IricVA]MDJ1256714.1 D-alanyl-D-alanine carboxypeptidase/D-alanyl-D-alanine-endopeptidase [Candidatus Midichloria mitochondrii]MDJ1288426.1 D-alanyl-D-alanine carboxypeptidase/D-alanyl-D-alanine-endopeptidase [Candidatus Midichloria mitochondrii]MDJ1299288.1 D-alanyl-D-alan